jgi:hypothetical protein
MAPRTDREKLEALRTLIKAFGISRVARAAGTSRSQVKAKQQSVRRSSLRNLCGRRAYLRDAQRDASLDLRERNQRLETLRTKIGRPEIQAIANKGAIPQEPIIAKFESVVQAR